MPESPCDPSIPTLEVANKALDTADEALRRLGHSDLAEGVIAVRIEYMARYPIPDWPGSED